MSGETTIEEVCVFRLRMPLSTPYHVSGRRFDHFDLFLAQAQIEGREGIGETVTAPGYSHETNELVWRLLRGWARQLPSMEIEDALRLLRPVQRGCPFATAAMMTAVETAIQPLRSLEDAKIRLVGTVLTHEDEELEEAVEGLLQQGYGTLKVKVGWDEREDATRVGRIQDLVGDRALIRVDANQGYNLEQARYFVHHVDPESIELFEQPFGIDDWDGMARLSKDSPLPLMLDESIDSEEKLEKLIRLSCAKWVKFKLMKAGSLERLAQLILRAKEAGLKVVLGNGVAGDIGDFHELMVAVQHIETAGEMNGFLKQEQRLLSNPYGVSHGRVVLPKGYIPQVDWEKAESYVVEASPVAVSRK